MKHPCKLDASCLVNKDLTSEQVYKVPDFESDLFQTSSIPLIEDVKPTPLRVWVCDLAISY
jgi:hypothetical protein